MENVPNILAMRNGRYRHQIVNAFRAAGYERTAVVTLTAADFGVPQERHRVFFIGLCDSLPFEGTVDQACARLFAVRMSDSRITVRQAISDLPEGVAIDDGALPYPGRRPGRYTEYQKVMRLDFDTALLSKQVKAAQLADGMALHNHHTKGIEDRRRRIIEAIRPGRRGDSLPPELWKGTRAHKWRRLDPKRPSYTILAQMHRDLSEWIHPEFDRWITVREAARLQSFHDGFRFCGSEYQQLRCRAGCRCRPQAEANNSSDRGARDSRARADRSLPRPRHQLGRGSHRPAAVEPEPSPAARNTP